jgi:hypothetical protein
MTVIPLRRRPWKGAREPEKQQWLHGQVIPDLKTHAGRVLAREFEVAPDIVAKVAGLVVNLNSFLEIPRGVYGSYAGLANHIKKNALGDTISARQVRRAIAWLIARRHVIAIKRPGRTNLLIPGSGPSGQIGQTDVVVQGAGAPAEPDRVPDSHLGRTGRGPCPDRPTNLSNKPSTQTLEALPQPPLADGLGCVAQDGKASNKWQEIKALLRDQEWFGTDLVEAWLGDEKLFAEISAGILTLTAASKFVATYNARHHEPMILGAAQRVDASIKEVVFKHLARRP